MVEIISWGAAIIFALAGLFFLYIKKVPHGWVQFKSGLVLKFLPALDSVPVLQLRKSLEDFVAKKIPAIQKSLPVASIEEIKIPTRFGFINGRLFQNGNRVNSHILVLIHGGGWCVGSVNTYEEVSRRLVRESGNSLISLDYSLAPEYKFPHAHDECVDAVTWISENSGKLVGSKTPLALIGDSAGGNLILSTAYNCSQAVKNSIEKLIAVYPVTDSQKSDYKSGKDYAFGYYLTRKAMDQFTEGLINTLSDLKDLRMSPIYYPKQEDFPETFVITAEFDPLRDQGEQFASKLKKDGNSVILKRYAGTIHAFFGLKDFGSRGLETIKDINTFLKGNAVPGIKELQH